jgi:hypothetical protein
MGRKIMDLVGRRFGRLTVIKEAGRNQRGQVRWLCRCDCGNEKIVLADNLRSGSTKSCGCQQHNNHSTLIDLTGRRFGRLLVLRRNGSISNYAAWICQCDCGKIVTVSSKHLLDGRTVSCGCYAQEIFPNITYTDTYKGTKISSLQDIPVEKSAKNKTGYRGIVYKEKENIYTVEIRLQGKRIYIGRYHNLDDAINARAVAVQKYNVPIIDEYKGENNNGDD